MIEAGIEWKLVMILRDMMYDGMGLRGYDYGGGQGASIPEQIILVI